MIITQGLVEAPVLDALFKFKPHPRPEDAMDALYQTEVQDAALAAAEIMRKLAREEDEKRKEKRISLINYRQFYVGSVGIGLILSGNTRFPYDWWAFAAVNLKTTKNDCKYCAEKRIVKAAKELRVSCIGGLVILGENQPDGRSGRTRNTLDPCGECRDMMRAPENRHMFRTRTAILKARPLGQVRYLETLPKMMAAHGETWP